MADQVVYTDQTGTAQAQPTDDQNQPTESWDKASGVTYDSNLPEVGEIVDTDANPLDAEIRILRAHEEGEPDLQFTCTFDGNPRPGEDQVRKIQLESPTFRVETPPAGASGGTFSFAWRQVEPPVA
jgi:hypothetical protein